MGEAPVGDLARYQEIRNAVIAAKKIGVTEIAKRRELVIDAKSINSKLKVPWITYEQKENFPSVAKADLRDEDPRTIQTAIHKYFEVLGKNYSKRRAIVEAIHSRKPNDGELDRVKKDSQIDDVKKLKQKYEVGTHDLATAISDEIHVPVLIAKKSRIWTDLNRAWFKTTIADEVKTAEFSRSGKAAQYFAYRQLLMEGEHLDANEKVNLPFLSLSIHGMKDHRTFGFAIAGGVESASSEVITWFQESLTAELAEVGITEVVKIDKTGDYSGLQSLVDYTAKPEEVKNRQHPSFGQDFNKIQLEIGKRYREGENKEKVAKALSVVLNRFEEHFK